MNRLGLEFHLVPGTDWRGGILAIAPHETDDDLELYALGRLTEERVANVDEHLLICASCRKRLNEAEAFAVAMREAIGGEPKAAASTNWHWLSAWRQPGLAWAGAFASLLVALGLFVHFGVTPVAPLATLQLAAVRGEMPTVTQARETYISLIDAPAVTGLKAEVVDSNAGILWTGPLPLRDAHRIRLTKQLDPGDYFVRLYSDDGKLLHEYGFQVRPPR